MNLSARFDRWVNEGPFTPADLGVFRIIYAVCVLLTTRDTAWIAQYPDSGLSAPPGPFMFLTGYPPSSVLVSLEVLRSAALVLLALGLFTRFASVAVSALLLATLGITYTLGKIDHTFLTVLAPLVLMFANWGDRFSLDAIRRPRAPRPQPQWPLRYLAFCVALSFFSTAFVKLVTGYLNPSNQAVRGWLLWWVRDGAPDGWIQGWLSGVAVKINSTLMWEAFDWIGVLFEFAIFFTVIWWRWFRTALAVATVFHVVVFLLFGIIHITELIVYGAFVQWGVLAAKAWWPKSFTTRRNIDSAAVILLVVAGIYKTWAIIAGHDWVEHFAGIAILFAGGAIGAGYLIVQTREILTQRTRTPSASTSC